MSNERILVVDENPANLRLVYDLFERSGYRISKAMDAEQALDAGLATLCASDALDLPEQT
jgi:CheY-like chemotaxis protein